MIEYTNKVEILKGVIKIIELLKTIVNQQDKIIRLLEKKGN